MSATVACWSEVLACLEIGFAVNEKMKKRTETCRMKETSLMSNQKEAKNGEQGFDQQFVNRLARYAAVFVNLSDQDSKWESPFEDVSYQPLDFADSILQDLGSSLADETVFGVKDGILAFSYCCITQT
jgi:hypothetical protein